MGVFQVRRLPIRRLPIRRLPIRQLPICRLNKNCPRPYWPYSPKRMGSRIGCCWQSPSLTEVFCTEPRQHSCICNREELVSACSVRGAINRWHLQNSSTTFSSKSWLCIAFSMASSFLLSTACCLESPGQCMTSASRLLATRWTILDFYLLFKESLESLKILSLHSFRQQKLSSLEPPAKDVFFTSLRLCGGEFDSLGCNRCTKPTQAWASLFQKFLLCLFSLAWAILNQQNLLFRATSFFLQLL